LHWIEEVTVIRRQVVMPVSPERLWEALTEPDQIAGWFGGRVDWQLDEGAPVHFRGDDGDERAGVIEAVRPGRHLRFRWWPIGPGEGDGGESEGEGDGASEVSYVLQPDGDGTRLTVQERPVEQDALPQAHATARGDWSTWDSRLFSAWACAAPQLAGR
jgi:uncharacterized protein YndB with AHSA1/START domain